jgi:predicted nuclease of restriction endonuclease-like (RecB) superfamily
MVAIVALKNPQARQFYAQHAAQDRWSVLLGGGEDE